ncbi:MAG: citrate lyase subunit alpha [Acholeplasmatales bacterium]|nr:MAG: citrate lyase subunit alpha [Acholeplasmatales bacterium]
MPVFYKTLDACLDALPLQSGMACSFHHHLRNGDGVLNQVCAALEARGMRDLHLYPSSIFPVHAPLADMIRRGTVSHLTTSYINGPVAEALGEGALKGTLRMQTHGGRARAFKEGDNQVDIAFIAAPAVDRDGHASGTLGPTACGSLGYALSDVAHARIKVLVTDHLVDTLDTPQIDGAAIDAVVVCESLGDPRGILSGTTAPTRDPIGVKIARQAIEVMDAAGMIYEGFSYQSGAGGISLRATQLLEQSMVTRGVQASFFSGGITGMHARMLAAGRVQKLYDVQCFDLEAVKSLASHPDHHAISADAYANPANPERIIKNLGTVILGATEVDLAFNVNVTTDSYNTIIGGSGGHADTAEDAALTLIVTPLLKARIPIVREQVTTMTTAGAHIDVIVTERGIAVNPRRKDLMSKLQAAGCDLVDLPSLLARAHALSGPPKTWESKGRKIGIVEGRRGEIIDTLFGKVAIP